MGRLHSHGVKHDDESESGLLVHDLTGSSDASSDHYAVGYMGIGKLRQLHRRVDMKVYPIEEYGFALLYFTGSDHFNRSMRWYAHRRGLTLSDHGLSECLRQGYVEKIAQTRSLVCHTEEAIFEALGLEWRAPTERNCYGDS